MHYNNQKSYNIIILALVILIMILLSGDYNSTFANTPENDLNVIRCKLTTQINKNIPKPAIYKTNYLIRKVGKADFAKGDFIKITGRVLDARCNPVKYAQIQIWQADSNGNYYYLDEESYEKEDDLLFDRTLMKALNINTKYLRQKYNRSGKIDKSFPGSGMAITDNNGYYSFITIMPSPGKLEHSPRIYFEIKSKNSKKLQTCLFFPKKGQNGDLITEQTEETQNDLIAEIVDENVQLFDKVLLKYVYKYDIVIN